MTLKCANSDITRARELLQWEPKIALADGLASTIDYFRAKTD